MKTTTHSALKILFTVLFFSTVFLSCSIEKRHHRDGYYFGRSKQHATAVRSNDAVGDSEVDLAPIRPHLNSGDTLVQDSITDIAIVTNDHHDLSSESTVPSLERKLKRYGSTPNRFSSVKKNASQPIEPNKEIGTWFGVMAAIFFIGGILTLLAFGIGGPVVFVTALFFTCAVLCVVFASLYYPKAKTEPVTPEKAADNMNRTRLAIFSVPILFFLGLIVVASWLLGGRWLF